MDIISNLVVTDIMQPSTIRSAAGKHIEMKCRKTYGLSLCISGQITYTMNGQTFVSNPGSAILLPQGGYYTLHGDKDGLFPLINFQCENFALNRILVLPLKNPQACIKDFEMISAMFLFNENRLRIFGSFYELLNRIFQEQLPQDNRLYPIIRYIEANISDPGLSNCALAQQAGISEVYLRKLFSRRYNTSLKQYILNIRIRKAKQLLGDASMTVTAIAEACGFSSVYHFCRAFKKQTGSTPTQYAQNNRTYRI